MFNRCVYKCVTPLSLSISALAMSCYNTPEKKENRASVPDAPKKVRPKRERPEEHDMCPLLLDANCEERSSWLDNVKRKIVFFKASYHKLE